MFLGQANNLAVRRQAKTAVLYNSGNLNILRPYKRFENKHAIVLQTKASQQTSYAISI